MDIRSISDFYKFSLFIFDLDNTIYNEEDYLFQAYAAIAARFAGLIPSYDKKQLSLKLKEIYEHQGREKLFDKFLLTFNIDNGYISECLDILRTFKPERPIEINRYAKHILLDLKDRNKKIFVLTNGNADQQKNKIKNISWEGLDKQINFVFADEIEPKPSAAGVLHILKLSGIEKAKVVFIGDSESDRSCARNSGVDYLDINNLILFLSKHS
jgi:HAD superfamily hydrolase (TIGR01549 family)